MLIRNLGKTLWLLIMVFFIACDNEEDPNMANVVVTLKDSPGDYTAVNVEVIGVEIKMNSDDDNEGWISIDVDDSVYNLLDLTGGLEATLGEKAVPAGSISQIRMILGDNNTLVIDEDTTVLNTPSAQQSGLKLKINETLLAGITYTIALDFDAAKSVVKAGNSGRFNLKPVIRTITEATSGAISGVVIPDSLTTAVYAISGSDTVASSFAPAGVSNFLIEGIAEGKYHVAFDPGDMSGFQSTILENIEVSVGNITKLDSVTLELQ